MIIICLQKYISSSAFILPSSGVRQREPDGWAYVYKGDSYPTGEESQTHKFGPFHRTNAQQPDSPSEWGRET